MATYRVRDMGAAGSFAALIVQSIDSLQFSFLFRLVGDLYLPAPSEAPSPSPQSVLLTPFRDALFSALGVSDASGFLAEILYSYLSISPFPSRFRAYPEPDGGERVARYHVVRLSLESMVASFLLVDEPQEGDGVIAQIYFPLRCEPAQLKLFKYE